MSHIDFSAYTFHPVIPLPPGYDVYDLTSGYDPDRLRHSEYGVGKYNEYRPNMYKGDLYVDGRDHHIGIDLAAPVGEPVHAFYDGEIFLFAYNANELDYGHTLITRHRFNGVDLYALHGHLSKASLEGKSPGQPVRGGDVIAWVGDETENGGWNPHLHFQLSYLKPDVADMPGVVTKAALEQALKDYPDPQLVLGRLY